MIFGSPQTQGQVSPHVINKFKEISQSSAELSVTYTKHDWCQLFDIILQTDANSLIWFNLMCMVGVITIAIIK